MAYTTPNAKRDASGWSKFWSRVTEAQQIAANQDAVRTKVIADHNSSTGAHTAAAASVKFLNLTMTAFANLNVTNVVNDRTSSNFATPGYPSQNPSDQGGTQFPYDKYSDFYGYGRSLYDGFWSGIALCKGATASGGEAECALEVWATDWATTQVSHVVVRRATGSGASDFTPLTVGGQNPGYRMRHSWSVDGGGNTCPPTEVTNSINQDRTISEGLVNSRNYYDEFYQNSEAINAAIAVRHDGSNVSRAICFDELWGARFYESQRVTFDYANEFTATRFDDHDGAAKCVIPSAWALVQGVGSPAPGAVTPEIALLPGFDDTGCYVVLWRRPGLPTSGAGNYIHVGATLVPLSVPSAPTIGTFTASPTVNQGDPIYTDPAGTPSVLDKLDVNDDVLVNLWLQEHRENGLHSIPLDKFTGYAVKLTSSSFTASGSVGGVTTVTIESWPATDPIYFVGIVMDARGSGGTPTIVALALGGSETTAKVYIHTVEVGSVLTGKLTVIRISRV